MWFILDQFVGWVGVVLGWWIIHQTGAQAGNLHGIFMRAGVGLLTIFLMSVNIIALLNYTIDWSIAAIPLKTALAVLFLGVATFHKRRFDRL